MKIRIFVKNRARCLVEGSLCVSVLQSWIVEAAQLFDSVIIDNELSTNDLPAVQQTALFNKLEERNKIFLEEVRSNVIEAALNELGQ